jgi:hypothetical protein
VRDAVLVHFMLDPEANTEVEDLKLDNPKKHAIYEAREALISFVCHGNASSPECAASRIYLADAEGDLDEVHDGQIWKAVADDVRHVRSGRYDGQRFADTVRGYGMGWFRGSLMDEVREAERSTADAEG